jgi:hypothetical protein
MKQFKSKAELFAHLVENKDELITAKRSVIKTSDPCEVISIATKLKLSGNTVDKAKYRYEDNTEEGKLVRTIIANTYLWMDSHDDVHLENVFAKSISENKRIRHLHDHVQMLDGKVGRPIGFEEKAISWRELGLGKTGMTQALFMESEVLSAYNEKVYNEYLNDEIDQHSVGMQYTRIELAVNDETNYPNEYKVYQQHIAKIGNRAKVEDQGFFFAVSEAKLLEVSAVLLGSNELTPTLGHKAVSPEKFTIQPSAPKDFTRIAAAVGKWNKQLKTI